MKDVRVANFSDIPMIQEMGREAFDRSRYSQSCSFDETSSRSTLITFMEQQARGSSICLVANDGCFIGSVAPMYATTAYVATNYFWYASKGARALTAFSLLRSFMAWASQMDGHVVFRIGASDAIADLEKIDRAMSTMGFRFSGGIYEMEVS